MYDADSNRRLAYDNAGATIRRYLCEGQTAPGGAHNPTTSQRLLLIQKSADAGATWADDESFAWTPNGELHIRTTSAGTETYEWGAEGTLEAATTAQDVRVEYDYDEQGTLVARRGTSADGSARRESIFIALTASRLRFGGIPPGRLWPLLRRVCENAAALPGIARLCTREVDGGAGGGRRPAPR